jgi:tetratricopeptide (TPR) repeat protein
MADAAHLSAEQRLMQAFYGLAFYVRKSLVPTGLTPAYLLDVELDPMAAPYLVSALAVLVAAGALVAMRRRWPAALAAFACYAILVLPVLGLTQAGIQIAADRYAYVAAIPLAVMAGVLFASGGRTGLALAAVAVVALGIMTWRQAAVWHDSIALWNHTLAVDPDNWLAYNSRGIAHQKAGDLGRARADFDAAIQLAPRYVGAYNNRGHLRVAAGDVTGALEDWNRALEIAPRHADALLNRGAARLMQGDLPGGVADMEASVRIQPGSVQGWYNLATAHAVLGQTEAAIEDCRRALAMAPPGSPVRMRIEAKLAALLGTGG